MQMVATTQVRKYEVRVFLVQDYELYGHASYTLKEAIALAGKYRYPFQLLSPKPQVPLIGAMIRYYLGAFDILENGELDTEFARGLEETHRLVHTRRKDKGIESYRQAPTHTKIDSYFEPSNVGRV
jgi:hypothetical protein